MNEADPPLLANTLVFRMGTIGSVLTERFTALIAEHELKPKHAGLLVALAVHGANSQLELARLMGVAPSLIVSLADHLERLGAVRRVRDPVDRRRQTLVVTDTGHALLARCAEAAGQIDAEIAAQLGARDRTELHRVLGVLAEHTGLPT